MASSLITVRLYNNDGTPKTGATPLLSAIKQSDRTLELNNVTMDEISHGFYEYVFATYDRYELYFFFIDGEPYDDINKFDSYGNKNTRGRDNSIVINTEKLAKDIWSAKESDMKKGTVGEYVFSLKNTTTEELEMNINKLFLQTFTKSDELQSSLRLAIADIKMPKSLTAKDITKPIDHIINNRLKEYTDSTLEGLETIKEIISDNVNNNPNVREEESSLYEEIAKIANKLDTMRSIGGSISMGGDMDDPLESINSQLLEINRKMGILFTRLNSK